jgi:hypothetical protein
MDIRHSPTRFGTLKCHHQGVNHDPAEIVAQCCRNLKDMLKYIVKFVTIYLYIFTVKLLTTYFNLMLSIPLCIII